MSTPPKTVPEIATTSPATLPHVAIVGRPNVGKSTLLNRVVGRREAIVEEQPGVTRDRREHTVDWCGRSFVLIDTGGWEVDPHGPIESAVRLQAERAIADADAIVLVCDATVGVTSADAEAARLVRQAGIPVVLAVNKVDGPSAEYDLADFYGLGVGDPRPVSALHGRRSGDLLDAVLDALPVVNEADAAASLATAAVAVEAQIAIVGRPNVGKSTLFNRFCGDERSIVHDEPGTTRDAVDTVVAYAGHIYRFVDTAGLRRRAKVGDRTEYYSRVRAIQAVERADVALITIDATQGVTAADQRVGEEVEAAGCAAVILLNKWDLLDHDTKLDIPRQVGEMLHFLDWAPVLRISARTGQNMHRLHDILQTVLASHRMRVPTSAVTKVTEDAQQRHPAPISGGKHGRIRYATQVRHSPPTFVFFTDRRLPPDYVRYLERCLRERFGFEGTPIRLKMRLKEKK